ncbi:unnamed protein product [Allacma fusca]|uniref:F-box domain-containing protein n=1 Tax=Allacma fusca TaxID=39272 RepID=A0A8J2JPD6_9HEXA|nr:unnamed protein product [Allacma fusca]
MKGKEYPKNLEILFESILPFLTLEDLKNCRQLNSTWKYIVETAVRFARICSDSTILQLNKEFSDAHLSIRVENLINPITDDQILFASKVKLLFVEPFPKGHNSNSRDLCESSVIGVNSKPTVSFPNFIKILWSCINVHRLILNQGALAHTQLDRACFQGLARTLIHLKHLGVILTGNKELQNLRYIFGEKFPHLEFLSVCYHKIRHAPTLEQYVEILMFILKHKETLRDIVMSDPPMVPNQLEPTTGGKKTKKRKKLKNPQQSQPNTFQEYLTHFRREFETLQLHGIGIKFTENQFSCWGLGMTILENRKNLVLIYLSKIPAIVAEKLAWENSCTLQVLNLKGIPYDMRPELSKAFNCTCLSQCYNLSELELSDFYNYRHVERLPFKKLKSLQMLTYMGNDSLYGKEALCSCEAAETMAEELKVVEKIVLFRSSMMTCKLTNKLCQLETLQEITLLGFKGKYFNNERLRLLYENGPAARRDFIEQNHKPSNYGDGNPFCICNSRDYADELHKICSESSLCPSCVRIIFPKGPKTRWDKLNPSIRHIILSYLSFEDLCSARLVSRSWSQDALAFLQYGICFSDKSKDYICKTSLSNILYLAVANLKSVIPYEKFYFARFVQTLVLEYNEVSFTKPNSVNLSTVPTNDILNSFPEEHFTKPFL